MAYFELAPGVAVECREGSYDELVFRESWRDDQYRMTTIPRPRGGYALDLGSNVGAWSILAARAGAKVYAVECWAGNNDQHVRNKIEAHVVDQIVIIEAAVVGHDTATGKVALDNIGDIAQVGVQTHDIEPGVDDPRPQVRAIHINELLAMHEHWWCLKSDIEGGEFDVFAGVDLGLLNRVDYIVGEFHGAETGEHVRWIGDAQFGDLVTKLSQWGNVTTMGIPVRGGNFFGHRFGVEAPVLGIERVPIPIWLRH